MSVNDNLTPMTLDQLIANLQAIRSQLGGDVPVGMCDSEPVVRAGVVWFTPVEERLRRMDAGEGDSRFAKPGEGDPVVIITDRYEEDKEPHP